jgi:thioredoxin 2
VRHLDHTAHCDLCKAELSPFREPIEVDPALFDEIVRESPLPILVDFWAAWCGPCRMAAPEVERTAAETAGHAIVLKVDTEKYPELAARGSGCLGTLSGCYLFSNCRVVDLTG